MPDIHIWYASQIRGITAVGLLVSAQRTHMTRQEDTTHMWWFVMVDFQNVPKLFEYWSNRNSEHIFEIGDLELVIEFLISHRWSRFLYFLNVFLRKMVKKQRNSRNFAINTAPTLFCCTPLERARRFTYVRCIIISKW